MLAEWLKATRVKRVALTRGPWVRIPHNNLKLGAVVVAVKYGGLLILLHGFESHRPRKINVMTDKLKEMVDYLRKMGATVVIDDNPSEEKIARIKEQLKNKKRLFRKCCNS